MNQPRKCTAIKSLLFLALMGAAALACAAQAAGTVMYLSGPLLAKKADGTIRILAAKSEVGPGDTLFTQKNGYAQIRFSDDSQLVLQPDTALTIDKFSYDASKPESDNAAFTLIQGGVRSTGGLLGQRSKDRVVLATPVANMNLQGASVIVQYRPPGAEAIAARQAYLLASTAALDAPSATRSDAPSANAIMPMMLAQGMFRPPATPPGLPPGLAPGLYVQVLDGMIHVTNGGGASNFSAGQFGYTPSFRQPPVILPVNPGMQFTPPPAFSIPPAPSGGTSIAPKSNTIDCEVR